jgi:hypothetical protein
MHKQYNRTVTVNQAFKPHVDHSFIEMNAKIVLNVQGIRLDRIQFTLKPMNVEFIAKLESFRKVAGKAKRPSDSVGPTLSNVRMLCHAARHLWIQLEDWTNNLDHESLLSIFFRMLKSDDELDDSQRRILIAMVSRDPLTAMHLLSLKEVNVPSEESCAVCTGVELFKNHLEALNCSHLPVLYDSPDVKEHNDLFLYGNYASMVQVVVQKADGKPSHIPNYSDTSTDLVYLDAERAKFYETFGLSAEYAYSWSRHKLSQLRFFVTEGGDLGYSSGSIRSGDEIFLVGDAWSLYALRPQESGSHIFCGQVYADSIYEGSSKTPAIRGTGAQYPRNAMKSLFTLRESFKTGTHPASPFIVLYDLNPGLRQDVQLV